ncbi:MAG TPA: aldose epimerase family protein, partial [Vicinamibacterales bacterium]|nr:aldose epimerase family protein [Vicinamibacterales bacterium]
TELEPAHSPESYTIRTSPESRVQSPGSRVQSPASGGKMKKALFVAIVLGVAMGCGGGDSKAPAAAPKPEESIRVQKEPFGQTKDGTPVDIITLRNGKGIEMKVITYGGIITSLKTLDRNGAADDIVMGHDSVAAYEANSPYFGSLIGRVGNRIAKGTFTLDGQKYTLAKNNGENHLHGGIKGWDKVVWKLAGDPFQDRSGVGVRLEYTSPAGEEGYPGTVTAHVNYTLTPDNKLIVDYHATTDKPTVINLTQHSYFNLGGGKTTDILGHEVMLNADRYTPVDATLIPTGELAPVAGTPFDFRTSTAIGARINDKNTQLEYGKGYDHNWVLSRTGGGLQLAARVYEPTTGRTLEIATTEPGIQFYTGNFLDGTIKGKGGRVYPLRSGFCLETQHFPDSPNKPSFPSIELRPGAEYKSQTVFTFGAR